jgi:lipoate-protein ligase A
MEAGLLERLVRIGQPNLAAVGVRSANKVVSPLSWFTKRSCSEVARDLAERFSRQFRTHPSEAGPHELDAALQLVATKYSTPAWVNRLP